MQNAMAKVGLQNNKTKLVSSYKHAEWIEEI